MINHSSIYVQAPNFTQIGYFFTLHVFPFIFGGGGLLVAYRLARNAVLVIMHRNEILNKPKEISERLARQFKVPHPNLLVWTAGAASAGFLCWLIVTGTLPGFDRSTIAAAYVLYFVFAAMQFVLWVVAIVLAFKASGKWGLGTLVGGGVPVVSITIVLALVPQEEFLLEAIAVLATLMLSSTVFCLYGPTLESAAVAAKSKIKPA